MKQILLCFILLFALTNVRAQDQEVSTLPTGKYEMVLKGKKGKWEKGDIVIMDDNQYRITSSSEVGNYRFSVTSQRIFFTSGPLKSVFAKTTVTGHQTAIVLPHSENKQADLSLPADVYGYLKQ